MFKKIDTTSRKVKKKKNSIQAFKHMPKSPKFFHAQKQKQP